MKIPTELYGVEIILFTYKNGKYIIGPHEIVHKNVSDIPLTLEELLECKYKYYDVQDDKIQIRIMPYKYEENKPYRTQLFLNDSLHNNISEFEEIIENVIEIAQNKAKTSEIIVG